MFHFEQYEFRNPYKFILITLALKSIGTLTEWYHNFYSINIKIFFMFFLQFEEQELEKPAWQIYKYELTRIEHF